MPHSTRNFTVADPRDFDGNPYDVGARALAQLRGILQQVELSLPVTELMVRNAELERQMALDQDPDAVNWPTSPQGKKFYAVRVKLDDLKNELSAMERAASYDPRHPPTA